ncbi:MAG: RsmB/NOP family class I SAM-dependent RNA methyltransferase [Promethearchaeota archaeon]
MPPPSSIQDDLYKLMKRDNYREYIVERLILLHGEKKALDIMKAFSKPPVPSIRFNPTIVNKNNIIRRIRNKGYILRAIPWCDDGYWIFDKAHMKGLDDYSQTTRFSLSPGATHEYLQGYYSLQGSSSMIPAILLDPKANDEVLDMAAAPGSKFVQMAQYMRNNGVLVGVEKSRDRIKALKSNVQRCGVKNSILVHGDSRFLMDSFDGFDKVLLDAPCTGGGLMGSDTSRKHSRTITDIQTMMGIQIQLLQSAIDVTKPGGTIVYSTCSLAPEENENVVTDVLNKNRHVNIVPPPEKIAKHFDGGFSKAFGVTFHKNMKYAVRVLPTSHEARPEGFFSVILRKTR